MKPTIQINQYGEFEVCIYVSAAAALLAYRRLVQSTSFRLFDHDPPEDYEPGLGGWAIFDGPGVMGAGVVIDDCESFVRITGEVHPEGDDRLDGTVVPTELSLDDRLAVASVVREMVL